MSLLSVKMFVNRKLSTVTCMRQKKFRLTEFSATYGKKMV